MTYPLHSLIVKVYMRDFDRMACCKKRIRVNNETVILGGDLHLSC